MHISYYKRICQVYSCSLLRGCTSFLLKLENHISIYFLFANFLKKSNHYHRNQIIFSPHPATFRSKFSCVKGVGDDAKVLRFY